MPQKLWQCDYCKATFATREECLEHESTHAKVIACKHVGRNSVEATCRILNRDGTMLMTFEWQRKDRPVSVSFEFEREALGIDAKDSKPIIDIDDSAIS